MTRRQAKNQEQIVEGEISTLQDLIEKKKEEAHSKEIVLTEKNSLFEQIKNDKELKYAEFTRYSTQYENESRERVCGNLKKNSITLLKNWRKSDR